MKFQQKQNFQRSHRICFF